MNIETQPGAVSAVDQPRFKPSLTKRVSVLDGEKVYNERRKCMIEERKRSIEHELGEESANRNLMHRCSGEGSVAFKSLGTKRSRSRDHALTSFDSIPENQDINGLVESGDSCGISYKDVDVDILEFQTLTHGVALAKLLHDSNKLKEAHEILDIMDGVVLESNILPSNVESIEHGSLTKLRKEHRLTLIKPLQKRKSIFHRLIASCTCTRWEL